MQSYYLYCSYIQCRYYLCSIQHNSFWLWRTNVSLSVFDVSNLLRLFIIFLMNYLCDLLCVQNTCYIDRIKHVYPSSEKIMITFFYKILNIREKYERRTYISNHMITSMMEKWKIKACDILPFYAKKSTNFLPCNQLLQKVLLRNQFLFEIDLCIK